MKRLTTILAAAFLCLTFFSTFSWAQTSLADYHLYPPATQEAKVGTRWWWFGSAVDSANLAYNLQEYARCGIGTVEITPIYGVKGNEKRNVEFLSDKWMENLRTTQRLARENNITVEMATGTGWPFGGPMVPLEESACRAIFVKRTVADAGALKLDILPEEKDRKNSTLQIVMAFPTSTKDDIKLPEPIDVTRYAHEGTLSWTPPALAADSSVKWQVVALYVKRGIMKVKRPAPGGEGFVIDHFDSTAVAHYLNHISNRFVETGTPFPHVFFNDSYEVADGDWTASLLEEFEKRRGYKLQNRLMQLLSGETTVLSDYRETLAELLLENFTRQWTAWAHSHGALTRNQAHGSPANLIDCYSAVDIPEIEGFGLSELGIRGLRVDSGMTRKNDSDLSMLKYAPSAAHVTGKNLCSSETFTWLTEHFRTSLSQLKPDLDLMFCAGVNHIYTHGTSYSPREAAWPGWKFYASIDMSPTNSIWHDAPFFMKYAERCQQYLQWGQPDNDFLVLLPVRDMWHKDIKKLLMQFSIHQMGELAPEFISTILDIDKAGFDCDYISEQLLMSTTFKDGMLQTAGGTRYKGLIIPAADTKLTNEVREHIDKLRTEGAHIIYGVDTMAMNLCASPEEMKTRLGIKLIRRSNKEGHHYFIANLSPYDIDEYVPLAVDYTDALWINPLNGKEYNTEKILADGKNCIRIKLRSGESLILQTVNHKLPKAKERLNVQQKLITEISGNWNLSFTADTYPHNTHVYDIDKLTSWEQLDTLTACAMGTGVYETTLKLDKADVPRHAEWTIDLGDVRESACVYINNVFAGCAWSVPFSLRFNGLLHAGDNTIRIEVTNLPANRIAEMDRKGTEWRIMEDINIVNIHYKRTTYADWMPVTSGLVGPVKLYCGRKEK